jgi:uncharacterized membrane protein
MKKELIIFGIIFIVLAIGIHISEWMSYPIEHIMALPNSAAYGMGAIHPIIFTLIVYILISIPRGLGKLFKKNKVSESNE